MGTRSKIFFRIAVTLLTANAAFAVELDQLGERSQDKLKTLNAAIVRNPRSSDAYVDRAEFYGLAFMEDEADRDFAKALSLDPKNFNAYEKRGLYRMHQENFREAITDLMRAGALAPPGKKGAPYRNVGRAQLRLKQNAEAVKTLTLAIANEAPTARHLSMKERARAYLALGKYKEAIADVDAMERDHELHDDETLAIRGEAELKTGFYNDALDDFSDAIRRNKRAHTNFEKVVFSSPVGHYYLMRAECYKKMGKPDKAAADMAKAKSADNDALKYAPFR